MKTQTLIILIGVSFLIGLCVLLVNPQYRIDENLKSNADYFAGIEEQMDPDEQPESISSNVDDTVTKNELDELARELVPDTR